MAPNLAASIRSYTIDRSPRIVSVVLGLLFALTPATRLEARQASIEVEAVGPVIPRASWSATDRHELEPHVAVFSDAPENRTIAAMISPPGDLSEIDCVVYSAAPGADGWERQELGLAGCGDPWTAYTRQGTGLVSVLGDGGIEVFRKDRGDDTWPTPGAFIEGAHDHEMMTLSPADGSVYLVSGESVRNDEGRSASAIFVARSTDDGLSFVPMSRSVVHDLSYEAGTPVILSDGMVLVPLQDHHTWNGRRLNTRRSWLIRSDDFGSTFGTPILIDEGCNRRGPVGWPSMGASPSGSGAQSRLYWVCEREEADGIRIVRSEDQGVTWTEPMRIDTRGDGGEPSWTKVPTVVTLSNGALAVTWFGAVGGGNESARCTRLFIAVSSDGGETFQEPLTVSNEDSCPAVPEEDAVPSRFPVGGDYIGAAPLGVDSILLVWPHFADGRFRLWEATVHIRP